MRKKCTAGDPLRIRSDQLNPKWRRAGDPLRIRSKDSHGGGRGAPDEGPQRTSARADCKSPTGRPLESARAPPGSAKVDLAGRKGKTKGFRPLPGAPQELFEDLCSTRGVLKIFVKIFGRPVKNRARPKNPLSCIGRARRCRKGGLSHALISSARPIVERIRSNRRGGAHHEEG